jgi:HEPN domain-containing protein
VWQASTTGAPALKAIHFLGWADDDYICARTLLIDGFLVQGAMFANTAVEKYLKAVMLVKGIKLMKTHNVIRLYDRLKGSGIAPLNEGYLRALGKAYKMRYPDDLERNFNLGLCQSQLLAELDASVHRIRTGFGLRRNDGTPMKTSFDTMLENSDPLLINRNSAFAAYKREELFQQPVPCYDMRVMPDGTIVQIKYTAQSKDDGDFEGEACKPEPPPEAE